ncbi:MAG: chemotaxis protein CheW [Hyphomicrobiales bacterium]|nr:chemotaxis protein CheW [Hyphomicrobiales bacterium]
MIHAPLTSSHAGDADGSTFTVFVGAEVFGLSVRQTQTIFRIASLTPVPLCPPEIAGLVNLRGKIVTAVSLRQRLGLPCERSFNNALAISIDHRGESFALIVDKVGDVLTLDAAMQIQTPPHIDPRRARFTSGIYQTGDMLIPVLDIAALFDFAR